MFSTLRSVGVEPTEATPIWRRARHQPRAAGSPAGHKVAAVIEARPDADGTMMITFRVPRAAGAERISVVGEFNNWSPLANPMERGEDDFVARMSLPIGRVYRFRYLLDGHRWQNDWAADAYVGNEFGGDDSVIDLTVTGTRARMVRAARPRRVSDDVPGRRAVE